MRKRHNSLKSKSEHGRNLDRVGRNEARSAIVTRYPTGVFALAYRGSQFFWMGMNESDANRKLADLRIPENVVRWEEHYYDRSIPFSDPRCYKSRRYFPKQNDQRARSYQETAQTELFPPMDAR